MKKSTKVYHLRQRRSHRIVKGSMETSDMQAFQSQLEYYCDRAGIPSNEDGDMYAKLIGAIKKEKRLKGEPTFDEEALRSALMGWHNPHPAFFRWLTTALKLSEEERMCLTWSHLQRNDSYPKKWASYSIQ